MPLSAVFIRQLETNIYPDHYIKSFQSDTDLFLLEEYLNLAAKPDLTYCGVFEPLSTRKTECNQYTNPSLVADQ